MNETEPKRKKERKKNNKNPLDHAPLPCRGKPRLRRLLFHRLPETRRHQNHFTAILLLLLCLIVVEFPVARRLLSKQITNK